MVTSKSALRVHVGIRAAGVSIALLAVFVIAVMTPPLAKMCSGLARSEEPLGLLLVIGALCGYVIPLVGVTVWSMFVAYRILRHLSPSSVRQLCALGTIVLWLVASAQLVSLRPPISGLVLVPGSWASAVHLLLAIPAVMVYYFGSAWLIDRAALEESNAPATRCGFSRPAIALFAFFFWLISSGIIEDLAPKQRGYEHALEPMWGLIATFGTMILAVILYKLGVSIFGRKLASDSKRVLHRDSNVHG